MFTPVSQESRDKTMAEGTRVLSPKHSMCAYELTSTTTSTKILALDDDCLMKIFSFLLDFDLCAVHESCRRFEALSEQVFRAKYRSSDVHGGAKGCSKMGNAVCSSAREGIPNRELRRNYQPIRKLDRKHLALSRLWRPHDNDHVVRVVV